MAEFTQDQILEIKKIIGDQYKMKGLNWKIVQSIPSLLEPNTLYFHQVSINPKKYDIYHTDKDKDIAKLDVYNQRIIDDKISAIQNELDTKAGELQGDFDDLSEHVDTAMKTAYLGIATTTTTPPATGAYWYRVNAPGTYMGVTVTQAELDGNFVFLNVTNGVVELSVSAMPPYPNEDFGRYLTLYDEGTVQINRDVDGRLTIATNQVMPVIFDDDTNRYMQIASGQTIVVDPAHYLLLSSSSTEYIKPNLNMPAGTALYFWKTYFTDDIMDTKPIILGFLTQHRWYPRYKALELTVTPPKLSQFQGKKITVEGDSIMEQGYVTSAISTLTGAIIDNRAKSGSGYVMDVGTGTIRSRINAISASNPDAIFIAGGTNDWGNSVPLGSKDVLNDDTQFYSAVYNTFRVLKENNPLIPMLVATPIIRNYVDTEPRGTLKNGKSLRDFCEAIIWCANQLSIEVCDLNYTSGITYENIFDVATDGVHVGVNGGKMMAGKIVEKLNNIVIL